MDEWHVDGKYIPWRHSSYDGNMMGLGDDVLYECNGKDLTYSKCAGVSCHNCIFYCAGGSRNHNIVDGLNRMKDKQKKEQIINMFVKDYVLRKQGK